VVPVLAFRADNAKSAPNQYFTGKIVLVEDIKAKIDAKTNATHALVSEGGKVYPLVPDAGSRMFAKDKRLLNRPMRLTARLHEKSNMLEVINVHSIKNGKLHDVYYWCDICTIKGFENHKCDCCGGPMELREVPVK
jgi:hypothetical protein